MFVINEEIMIGFCYRLTVFRDSFGLKSKIRQTVVESN